MEKKTEILKCQVCKEYTLEQTHCNKQTIPPKPARFSVVDKWSHFKREVKQDQRKEQGII